jgi:nicotinamide-nucleotide amidase
LTEDDITDGRARRWAPCLKKRVVVATAESCTGGGVATAITRISGSAKWFDRAFVTYSNEPSARCSACRAARSSAFGAVSEQVAREMARGALRRSPADLTVAITGIAGPTGGSR